MKKLFTFFAALACMASVAMADNINVVATQASARFYPEDNDVYIVLQNADYGFAFDVLCAAGSQDIVDGQTYTLDDMIVDYCYGVDQAAQAYINYVSASITRNNGSYTAVVVADDGNTYNITYTPAPVGTIDVVATQASALFYEEDNDLYIVLQNADYGFVFDVVCAAGSQDIVDGQTYTLDDMLVDYSYGVDQAAQDYINYVSASITRNNGSYTAVVVADDGNTYNITYSTPTMEDALDTTEVVIVNPTFTDYTSEDYSYYFMGYTVDSAYFAQINYYSHNLSVTGYFPFDSLYVQYCNVAINDDYTTSIAGHVTVTENEGAYDVDAYLMDEDYHAYHVTMHYVIPVAEDTIDVLVSQAAMEQIAGGWYSSASVTWTGTSDDENYNVNVSYYSSVVDGDFSFATVTSDSKINNVTFVSGHVTVSATNDGHQLEAYLLGNDSHCYHINMNYTVPTMEDATDTIEFTVANAELVDALASDGLFQFYGEDETEYYGCYLTAYASQIEGSYEFADFNTDYTSVYEDETRVSIVEGHFTVTATATGYTVDAYLLGANLHCYHVTMIYTSEGISTVNNVTVNVYPNPATDMIHVEANGINRIEVIDLAGRIVLSSTQAQNTINISTLANGIYMLRTSTVEGVNVQKIVKK